jgi:hypothetical protein
LEAWQSGRWLSAWLISWRRAEHRIRLTLQKPNQIGQLAQIG